MMGDRQKSAGPSTIARRRHQRCPFAPNGNLGTFRLKAAPREPTGGRGPETRAVRQLRTRRARAVPPRELSPPRGFDPPEVCMQLDWTDIVMRLGAATLAGIAIGLNRDLNNKPIGMRTLSLVSLGAATVTVASVQYSVMAEH